MTSQIFFQQAISAHQAGRLSDAERLYQQVLAADRGNFAAQYKLAFLLYKQQRTELALRAVEAALRLNPNSVEALLLQSVLELGAGQLEVAFTGISQVTSREPGNAEAWHTQGLVSHGLKRFEEAIHSFDKVLVLNPGHVGALCHRGNALMELGRFQDAVAAFDGALARAPTLYDAWSNRGLALFELERFAESLESYERAAAIRSDFPPAWTNRGKALDRLERFDEALASFAKALLLDPSNAAAYFARALTLRTMHRLDEALADTDRALAIHPQSLQLLYFRGWLLCELNRISDGLSLIARTAEVDMNTEGAAKAQDSAHKRRHDDEQATYLAGRGRKLREGEVYIAECGRLSGSAVNSGNAESAAAQWEQSRPRIAVIDNLLTPDALEMLRRFCWESTIWQQSYDTGYLGAVPEQGFASPLLAQIAEELRDNFRTIIGDHRLRMLWGFKYDSSLRGIGIHADQAAVNVNFWITPDEGVLDPQKGGMIIWDVAAPAEWDVKKYNGDEAAVRAFLKQSGAKPIAVPYRSNRAVVFDSDLFHETDDIRFKDDYLARRINITMLYGRRTHFGR